MYDYLYYYGAALISGLALFTAVYVVKGKDLLYSSVTLALTASLVALLVAFMGYTLIAAVQLIVYVGAAVMFIIISVSLLGAKDTSARNEVAGIVAGLTTFVALSLYAYKLYPAFTFVSNVNVDQLATVMLERYGLVIVLITVALAATIVEAISVAKRG
ncbi:MAG: NADH-quinone oxidoreductase subunit J [Desulfurococcales archaeon]|nr:NADH-quinone oxidoreductase subunit J [Desulfurococcales archaeon]